jgi:hypothetical protein
VFADHLSNCYRLSFVILCMNLHLCPDEAKNSLHQLLPFWTEQNPKHDHFKPSSSVSAPCLRSVCHEEGEEKDCVPSWLSQAADAKQWYLQRQLSTTFSTRYKQKNASVAGTSSGWHIEADQQRCSELSVVRRAHR